MVLRAPWIVEQEEIVCHPDESRKQQQGKEKKWVYMIQKQSHETVVFKAWTQFTSHTHVINRKKYKRPKGTFLTNRKLVADKTRTVGPVAHGAGGSPYSALFGPYLMYASRKGRKWDAGV